MNPHIHRAILDTSTNGALIIDAGALLNAIIQDHELDPNNTEHQHDALSELHRMIDELDHIPILLWDLTPTS